MEITFIDNKYTRMYFAIIEKSKLKIIEEYTEQHHIIPRSLGGDNSTANLVRLSAREHFICHWLLTKMTIGANRHKMIYAAWCMSMLTDRQGQYKIKSFTYAQLKESLSSMKKTIDPWNKGKTGCYVQTAESNQKRSIAMAGRISPNKGNFQELNPFFGKTHSEKSIAQIKETKRLNPKVP